MKRLFTFLLSIAVIAGMTSCAQEDISTSVITGEEVVVSFTTSLKDASTRTFGQGENVDKLYFNVYDAVNGDKLSHLSSTTTTTTPGKFTFQLTMVKGMKYDIVFWAQNSNCLAYTVNDDKSVVVDYTKIPANDDTADAFFGYVPSFDPVTATDTTFELTRPFAQLNAATADLSYLTNSGISNLTSTVAVEAHNTFDIVSGDVVGSKVNVEFDATAIPSEAFYKAGYTYLSMNYLLAPKASTIANTTFTFSGTKNGNDVVIPQTSYANIPLQQNYRTNILGELLTKEVEFTVEILPAFTNGNGTNSEIISVSSAEGAQAALDNAVAGTTIQLVPGVNYGTLVFRQNANNKVVDITYAGGDAPGNEKYSKYEDITIIGAEGAIVDQIDFQVSWVPNSGASYIDIKNLTLKDITFSGEKIAVNLEGAKSSALGIDGLLIDGCKMVDEDNEGEDRFVFQQITGYKELKDKSTNEYVMTTGVKNLTITNCEVTGAYMVIESRAMENLTITDNLFNGIKERDMLITSDTTNFPGVTYTGTITITGNTSICGEERFVRGSGFGDATVVIKDNTIINYLGEDDDYIKCDGTNTTIENNIVQSYGAYDTTTLGRAFARVSDNGSIVIVKDAALLAIPNSIAAKNVTISAYEGVKVGTLYQIGCGYCVGGILSLPENLTINGVTFDGSVGTSSNGAYCQGSHVIEQLDGVSGFIARWSKANGLTFNDCTFVNGAAISISGGASKNLVVDECSFDSTLSTAVSCYGTVGITVSDCTMDNIGFAAIFAGEDCNNITFTGNTVGSTGSRLVRMNNLASGAVLTITDNTFGQANANPQEAAENNDEIVKISNSNIVLTQSNNKYKGYPLTITEVSANNWFAYELQ